MNKRIHLLTITIALVLLASNMLAAPVGVPNNWSPGDTLNAIDLNANFAALEAAVNANDTGGTVTSVTAGVGLTGGPITTTGSLAISFGGNGSANSAARSDHFHYIRTVVVSPVPGDPVTSGKILFNALAAIVDADATNPYLLKLEPGIYDLGTQSLNMKEFVDIEGSGAGVFDITTGGTIITGSGTITIVGVRHTELRMLSVYNTRGTAISLTGVLPFNCSIDPGGKLTDLTIVAGVIGTATGILNDNSCPLIRNVTMRVTGSTGAFGLSIVNGSAPILEGVTMFVSSSNLPSTAIGIFNDSSNSSTLGATIRGSTISATSSTLVAPTGMGISNSGQIVTVESSFISGNLTSIFTAGAGSVVRIANGRIGGGINRGGGGTITCHAVSDANFVSGLDGNGLPHISACPDDPLNN